MLGILTFWFLIGTVSVEQKDLAEAYKLNALPVVGSTLAAPAGCLAGRTPRWPCAMT